MEFRFGGLTFTSKFDSGNLANVEKVSKEDEESDQTGQSMPSPIISVGVEIKPDLEFNVWTKPDCAGTQYANGNRSWFYFGVRGGPAGKVIKINIMNMNRQGRLYSQGHMPMVRTLPGRPKWERIRDKPTFETVNNNFVLSFTHRFFECRASVTYFAFSYPWSYETCQERLQELDEKFKSASELDSKSDKSSIYYHRELLCLSLECRRVDLITISDCHGIQDVQEPRFDKNLFPDHDSKRCKSFVGKKVYVVSSRVHPGETPGSFVFNGFLDFVLREDDLRAKQLRKQYVFKLIPMLNPDGVSRGHYRTDTRGVNLNRVYLDPTFELYPSIYAAKSLLVYHHIWNSDIPTEEKELIAACVLSESVTAAPMDLCSKNSEDGNLGSWVVSNDISRNALSDETRSFAFGCKVNESVDGPAGQQVSSMFDLEGHRTAESAGPIICNNPCPSIASLTVGSEMMQGISTLAAISKSSTAAVKNSELGMNTENLDLVASAGNFYLLNTENHHEGCSSAADDLLDFSGCHVDAFALEKTEIFARSVAEYIPKRDSLPSSVDLNDIPSGGECEDFEDDFQRGNEGSDEEGCDETPVISDVVNTPHLCHPKLLSIPARSSGIAIYIDLHGHAAKRGCFIYGNYFDEEETQIESMLFVRLIALNSAHFDFGGCNFTEKNMYMVDRKDGSSKEGSGRVAAFKALGIIHSYTLECNYNTGRLVNAIPQASGDDGRATPPPVAGFPPKYTPAHYEEVGRAMAVAAIDITATNPWSRLPSSDSLSVFGLREHLRRYLQSIRMPAKAVLSRTGKTGSKGSSQAVGALPKVSLLTKHSANHSGQQQNYENNVNTSCNGNSSILKASNRPETKKFASVLRKTDTSSIKDVPPRLAGCGLQRQRPVSYGSGLGTTVAPATCSQLPSSQVPSRRTARCAVMSLVPLSAPLALWTTSSDSLPKRQSSADLQLKVGSASSTSSRAQHLRSVFTQHSGISKSFSSDLMPTSDSPHDSYTLRKSVTNIMMTGITPETEAGIGLGSDRIPSVAASIYQWPASSRIGLRNQVADNISPGISRRPPSRAKKDSMEPGVLSGLSLAQELTSASLLSFSNTKRNEDEKRRSSIPVLRSSLAKKTESNAKIIITPLLGSSATTGSQLSSLPTTVNPVETTPMVASKEIKSRQTVKSKSEPCKSNVVKGNKPSTSCRFNNSVLPTGSRPSPQTGSKKTKQKKKTSSKT